MAGVAENHARHDSASSAARASERFHVLGADRSELQTWTAGVGLEAYRAGQIADWVFKKDAASFQEMSNLPKAARTALARHADIYTGRVLSESASADGATKLLIGWADGASAEAVWIPETDRHTACISSQVGCPVGCRFCASGLTGVERNLTAGEIVEQAMWIRRAIAARHAPAPADGRLSNIVLMGMGEPLANYREVVKAIRIINSPEGMAIGARKITLSTVGLPAQIRKLADEGLQVNLALSLHAPDDELRRRLIPWGKGVKIADLLAACDYYFKRTGREITLEYVLLAGVNDRLEHADKLAQVARRLRCNINLLRYNPVAGTPYARPTAETAFEFQRQLRRSGVNAHIRRSRGTDVNAACGQLRRMSMVTVGGVPGPEQV